MNIFINKLFPYSSGTILFDLSDHCPTFVHLKLNFLQRTNYYHKNKIVFRNYTDDNMIKFTEKLGLIDWNFISTSDVDHSFERFINIINNLYCDIFPVKTKFITDNRMNKPWLTHDLIQLIKLKSEYLHLYRIGAISKETNNRFKNFVTSKIRKAEHSYYLDSFKNAGKNMKKSWNIIKNLTGSNNSKKSSNSIFTSDDPNEKLFTVETFNKFFSSIGDHLDSRFGTNNFEPNFSFPNSFTL